jgi:hypothetical protein
LVGASGAIPDETTEVRFAVCSDRSGSYQLTIGNGSWGGWAFCPKFRPPGSFAYRANGDREFIEPSVGTQDLGDASTRIGYLTRFAGDLHDTSLEEAADLSLDASNPWACVGDSMSYPRSRRGGGA